MKVGSKYICYLWIAIEPENGQILAQNITRERKTCFVAERFLLDVVRNYGNHSVSTDGGGT
ncbi:MAG: hypothetical protein R2685_00490 [Candidatus Nitrosocosmicus sp.]|jgi:transposase-like protein|nr:hypothetical protein [Candidatus Nitrosocosmicus sp.]